MTSDFPLSPGKRIGILGGGQLGRMLATAAAQLGFHVTVMAPEASSPAGEVAQSYIQADYEDTDALKKFAGQVDVITYEFENVPAGPLNALERACPVFPSVKALEVTQDRLVEKDFLAGLGIPVTPYAEVSSLDDLCAAVARYGAPAMIKTRRFGYDGKGQEKLDNAGDAEGVYQSFNGAPAIYEAFIDFDYEISVVAARCQDGVTEVYDISQNIHSEQILRVCHVPAPVTDAIRGQAIEIARKFADAVGYVGVFAVEFFFCGEQAEVPLLVNEIAPRVHNTGHWTLDACVVSQFENHIRAIAGWPLGSSVRHSDARMVNLIGDDVKDVPNYAGQTNAAVHMYGKDSIRPGRKMGHVTVIKAKA